MKQWSIKRKLNLMSALLLGLMMLVGGIEFYGIRLLLGSLEEIKEVQLPTLGNVDSLDAGQSGLRGTIYHALDVGHIKEARDQIVADVEKDSQGMKHSLSDLEKLEDPAELLSLVKQIKPKTEKFLRMSEELLHLSIDGKKTQAEAKMPEYNQLFVDLENDISSLRLVIDKDFEVSAKNIESSTLKVEVLSVVLIVFGLILGVVFSLWIIKDLLAVLLPTIDQLKNSSRQVSDSSSQSAASATQLSEASTQQAASLQETMASVEQISAMINQNAESAVKVNKAVDANQHASDEGERSVADMVRAIDEIKSTNDNILMQMQDSNREFGEIVKIISEIGDKTKVINDIVFQTKLLSFNASVEAARAGEHGKGFAVVAEEVGNLAQMSGNAAKEISDMLSKSIMKVNDIVEQTTQRVDQLVEVGKDKISMGQMTAQKCREALLKIAENAKTVAVMIGEITHASKEQAQGIQEINKAISQLDQVTQQNSAVAQLSSTQAEGLHSESLVLSQAVKGLVDFTVGKNEGQVGFDGESKHATGAKVLNIGHHVAKPAGRRQVSVKPHGNGSGLKKASGATSVPSSDDPNFEEF